MCFPCLQTLRREIFTSTCIHSEYEHFNKFFLFSFPFSLDNFIRMHLKAAPHLLLGRRARFRQQWETISFATHLSWMDRIHHTATLPSETPWQIHRWGGEGFQLAELLAEQQNPWVPVSSSFQQPLRHPILPAAEHSDWQTNKDRVSFCFHLSPRQDIWMHVKMTLGNGRGTLVLHYRSRASPVSAFSQTDKIKEWRSLWMNIFW